MYGCTYNQQKRRLLLQTLRRFLVGGFLTLESVPSNFTATASPLALLTATSCFVLVVLLLLSRKVLVPAPASVPLGDASWLPFLLLQYGNKPDKLSYILHITGTSFFSFAAGPTIYKHLQSN